MAFPSTLDNLAATNPTASDTMAAVPHDAQHQKANTAIDALEAKIGINGSAVTTSLDYVTKRALADIATVSSAANINIDMEGAAVQTVTLTQDTTIAGTNLTAGKYKAVKVRFLASGGQRVLTFNSNMKLLDRTGTVTIPVDHSAIVVLESWGSAITDIYVSVGLET